MPSHGAMKQIAADMPPASKTPKVGAFHHMELSPGENGGAIAQHFHDVKHADGWSNVREHGLKHVFADGDGHKLAAHIEQHLGIKMPGRSTGTVASPAEGEAGKDESE
jgi:hypothetical protein